MIIFLSYASEHQTTAEEITIALEGSKHKVFFDKGSLPPGGDFRRRIRKAIDDSELFIFLISPESVRSGSFALTELTFAQKKWKNPEGYILPVMVARTPLKRVPAYLRAVTILEPKGDVAAEVSAMVDKWSPLEEIESGEIWEEQVGEAPQQFQGIFRFYHELGAFPKEVATNGHPNRTYRKTLPWSSDREGRIFDEPTTLTATRSQDFSDRQGRTCCEIRMTWRWHGEPQWRDLTNTFVLERGRWQEVTNNKSQTANPALDTSTGDPELDDLIELLKREKP